MLIEAINVEFWPFSASCRRVKCNVFCPSYHTNRYDPKANRSSVRNAVRRQTLVDFHHYIKIQNLVKNIPKMNFLPFLLSTLMAVDVVFLLYLPLSGRVFSRAIIALPMGFRLQSFACSQPPQSITLHQKLAPYQNLSYVSPCKKNFSISNFWKQS